jgi:hypothetical protein
VTEILLHAHASEFLVTRFLFELFRSGMVEIVGVRKLHEPEPVMAPEPEELLPVPVAAAPAPAPVPRPAPTAPRAAAPAPGPKALSPKDDPRKVQAALEAARRLQERGELDGALDLLNAVHKANPEDDALRRLVLEAEADFVDKAWKHYVPAAKIPALTRPVDALTGEALSPVEVFLLSRVDGTWDVKSIIQITPIREVDALRTLKKLRERGLIELKDPT